MLIKKENENRKTIAFKIKFMDNVRFITSSTSSLTDTPPDGLRTEKCKKCESEFEYVAARDNTLTFKCVGCHKIYGIKFDIDLTQRFQNTYNFGDGDLGKVAGKRLPTQIHGWLSKIL